MEYFGWLFAGLLVGGLASLIAAKRWHPFSSDRNDGGGSVTELLRTHFQPLTIDQLAISERQFPFRVRADLHRAIDDLFGNDTEIHHFCGVRKEYSVEGVTLSDCIVASSHNPAVSIPAEHEEIDIGEDEPVQVLKNGLWLLNKQETKYAVLLSPAGGFGQITGIQFQIGVPNTPQGTEITQQFFKHLEESILKAESYRGKILSLEQSEPSYSGAANGITVHKLRTVDREQVILPPSSKRTPQPFVTRGCRVVEFGVGSL